MLLATTADEAMQNQRVVHVNGRDYVLSEYIGAAPVRGRYVDGNEANDNGLPQGFLVDQPPGAVTLPHFHETNQFQVFVEGVGSMGKHAAIPLTVQYSNGHTPYGPIKASETGVKYFTLRQSWDPGAKYMPGSRAKLKMGNQRTRLKGNIGLLDDGGRRALSVPVVETIFEREEDGMAAWLYLAGADAKVVMPDTVDTGGQYLVVAGGALIVEDKIFDRWSVIFVTADDVACSGTAAGDGVELLVLQFPCASGADPLV